MVLLGCCWSRSHKLSWCTCSRHLMWQESAMSDLCIFSWSTWWPWGKVDVFSLLWSLWVIVESWWGPPVSVWLITCLCSSVWCVPWWLILSLGGTCWQAPLWVLSRMQRHVFWLRPQKCVLWGWNMRHDKILLALLYILFHIHGLPRMCQECAVP